MSALHKAIYFQRKRLGFDDDTARAFYQRTVGKDRLTLMSDAEHRRVLSALKSVGAAPAKGAVEPASKPVSRPVQGPYGKKLTALWIAMWHLGLVRDRRDEALVMFALKRVTVDHTRWLVDPAEGQKAVEALKDWMAREGGVDWNARGHAWLKHDAAKVALAQWKILHPADELDQAAFANAVWHALGRPEHLAAETAAAVSVREWQTVNRVWGAAVRKARKPA
ncbi:MAG: regulatory protein GemA [Rhizobiaceae bacterium]|nr:regulatory protein GemA [Rhizobiaceae bacterium]